MIKKQIVEINDNWLARLVSEYYSNNNFKPDPEPTKVGLCKYLLKHIELHEQSKPKPDPDYWLGYGLQAHTEKPFDGATPLYTTPPTREPLSDKQLHYFADECTPNTETGGLNYKCFARLVEQAHGIGVTQ